MSTLECPVVEIGPIEKHPNADSLSLTQVFGYPLVFRTGDYQEGDRAVYIPTDSLVPNTDPFAFLYPAEEGKRSPSQVRIRAKKLRGIFSQGLLVPAPQGADVGDNLAESLGVSHYQPPEKPLVRLHLGGKPEEQDSPPPVFAPEYTGIEHLRRHQHTFEQGEEVAVTEKIHGANARYLALWTEDGLRTWCGSHHRWRKKDGTSPWERALPEFLPDYLAEHGLVLYGEIYGAVQDLQYGLPSGQVRLRGFDAFDYRAERYLDWPEFEEVGRYLAHSGIGAAPVLYQGPYDFQKLVNLAEHDSTMSPGQMMEGIVVRPIKERFDPKIGRVILKLHSQRYLLRKGA